MTPVYVLYCSTERMTPKASDRESSAKKFFADLDVEEAERQAELRANDLRKIGEGECGSINISDQFCHKLRADLVCEYCCFIDDIFVQITILALDSIDDFSALCVRLKFREDSLYEEDLLRVRKF